MPRLGAVQVIRTLLKDPNIPAVDATVDEVFEITESCARDGVPGSLTSCAGALAVIARKGAGFGVRIYRSVAYIYNKDLIQRYVCGRNFEDLQLLNDVHAGRPAKFTLYAPTPGRLMERKRAIMNSANRGGHVPKKIRKHDPCVVPYRTDSEL
jgi:hypothetical protein